LAAAVRLGVSCGSGSSVAVNSAVFAPDVGGEVELGRGMEVAVGEVLAACIWAVGVRAEGSSRTIVGVGATLLGDAQAVKVKKVSKIKVILR